MIVVVMILLVLVVMIIILVLCGSILYLIFKGGYLYGDYGGELSLLGKCFIWFNYCFECVFNGFCSWVDGFFGWCMLGVVFYLVLSVVIGLLLWYLLGVFLFDED